jgi:two-component system CheB/CheR fusion protein
MNSWSLLVVEQGLTSGKPLKDHLEALDHYAAIRYVRELACPVTFANRGGTLQLSDAGGDSGAHGDFARWLATAPGTPDTAFTAHRRLVDIRARPGEFRRSAVWAIGCGFGGVLDGFAGRLPGLINNAILLKGCCEPATKGNPTMPKSKAPSKKALTSIEAAKETAASDPVEASRSQDFPIVGIGASAGGLAAIEVFFKAMPSHNETGMAFVVVQHLSPDHRSILTELIQRYTEMLVVEAEDGMEVKPNCVHIIPPNRDMAILGGKLQLFERETPHRVRHPIDFFFRSLAADRSERAICVVLSGTGADGALGVRAVKGEGGMAMAQSPESTEFDGMPRSAIATGLVDYVLAAGAMPAQLLKYVHQIVNKTLAGGQLAARQSPDVLAKICILLRASAGHDFSQYKETTVVRRVERRMALQQIENPADYLRYLQQNPAEVSALFRDLLIGVTNFFRDREAFAALEKLAIPQLVERTASEGTIRVWICGCSTGEEAYSIAILIQEQLERIGQLRRVQIFATDLDRRGTDQARAGLFPGSIEADVSAERLARFFRPDTSGGYRIVRLIRDQLIFSEQNVIKDPPLPERRPAETADSAVPLRAQSWGHIVSGKR